MDELFDEIVNHSGFESLNGLDQTVIQLLSISDSLLLPPIYYLMSVWAYLLDVNIFLPFVTWKDYILKPDMEYITNRMKLNPKYVELFP